MNNIPEAEARAILAKPLLCEDYSDWEPSLLQPDTVVLTAGVLNEEGVSARLIVELLFRRSKKTKLVRYCFTVFRRQTWGLERVYQLDVVQSPRFLKNVHELPHEHIGTKRDSGDASWATWSYDDVLKQFCTMSNITFLPVPPHPEEFTLRG